MSLPPLAEVSDLATWLGVTIDDGDARAEAVLDAASGLVRDAAGQTWVNTDASPTSLVDGIPQTAITITLTAAARAYLNPAGASSSTTGPFSAAWSAGAGVMLTDAERVALGAFQPSNLGGLGVIATTRGPMETPLVRDPFDGLGISGIPEADDPYSLWGVTP